MQQFLEHSHVQIVFHIPITTPPLPISSICAKRCLDYFIPVRAINPHIMHCQCRSKCSSTRDDVSPFSLMNLETTIGFESQKNRDNNLLLGYLDQTFGKDH